MFDELISAALPSHDIIITTIDNITIIGNHHQPSPSPPLSA